MPPEIIGLLAFIGLFVYAAIGGTLGMRLFDPKVKSGDGGYRADRHALIRGLAGERNGNEAAWFGFTPLALFWPVAAVALLIMIVCAGPIWVAHKVAVYSAKTQIELKERAA